MFRFLLPCVHIRSMCAHTFRSTFCGLGVELLVVAIWLAWVLSPGFAWGSEEPARGQIRRVELVHDSDLPRNNRTESKEKTCTHTYLTSEIHKSMMFPTMLMFIDHDRLCVCVLGSLSSYAHVYIYCAVMRRRWVTEQLCTRVRPMTEQLDDDWTNNDYPSNKWHTTTMK